MHTSTFYSKIFQACSSTLRFLRLSQMEFTSNSQQTAVSLTAEFPHLCSLNLAPMTPLSHSTLQSFLQSQRLSTLVVDFSDSITRECLDQVGYYPELHTFIWTGIEIPSTASLRSLEHNNHLMEFGTEYHQSPSLLDRVVSVLASFANLSVLSLIWDGTTIPNSSLLSIASITSLDSLHISCGNQNGWRYDWFIDHEAIRYNLSPLRNLKRLLFTRDSYPLNISLQGENQAGYYSYRMPTPADMIDFLENSMREDQEEEDLTEIVWEAVHREQMAWHAEKYAATFPELEWIHVGQLSFTFKQGADGKKKALVVDPKRNENFPIMETMFGISAE